MNINLKQIEIEQALRNYVVDQGINIEGKNVSMEFTAGRKGSGLTVDVTITDPTIKASGLATVVVKATASALTTTNGSTTVETAEVVTAQPKVEVETTEADPGYSTAAPTSGSLFT